MARLKKGYRQVRNGRRCLIRIWTAKEDQTIRVHAPGYAMIRRLLRRRTLSAIKQRARALEVAPRRHVWTNREVDRLADQVARGASDKELVAAFPELRPTQILKKIEHLKLKRPRRPLRQFGGAFQMIRNRALDGGLTMGELGQLAGSPQYFQAAKTNPDLAILARAAAALGGEIVIEWD